ncbi:phosphatase PAP2 family protein [Aggregatibacter actinomycetemcomitans]|uniref:phosphatase PAP2 family protein n=1 Tax=Aggregatibacter actinomycetemcomitans TaxID=714 RepID=UPI00197B2376|nr:phosphatase PAP2 family protein [Aggregatibacter actinomycetemcomitans]MBN6077547.1 phosphatase PAP2 family protein [Aggregatibacter actinomycetemcomitans]
MVMNMLKRLSLYTLLLCLVPVFVWLSAWQWSGNLVFEDYEHPLYWLTETGSVPYAVITCGVFALLFLPLFSNRKQWILAVAVMAFSMVVTQGLKSGLKNVFAEPRPFVTYIAEQTGTGTDAFYAQDRKARTQIVDRFYQTQSSVPEWIKGHYADEVGYSFPSGHTIFAASWLMLTVGFVQLLDNRKGSAKLLLGFMSIWALLMLVSRLRFGMHYPIDLLISVLMAWLVHWVMFAFLAKKRYFQKAE